MTAGRFPADEVFGKAATKKRRRKNNKVLSFLGLGELKPVSARVGLVIGVAFAAILIIGLPKIYTTPSATSLDTTSTIVQTTQSVKKASAITSTTGVDSAPTTLAQQGSSALTTPTTATGAFTSVSTASAPPMPQTPATTTTIQLADNSANSSVTVRVANGTAIPGLAASITSKLANLNFNVVVPINATVSNLTSTTVYYYTGFQVAGEAIARILGLSASAAVPYVSQAPLPDVYPSDVNVVLGSDVSG